MIHVYTLWPCICTCGGLLGVPEGVEILPFSSEKLVEGETVWSGMVARREDMGTSSS